MTTTSDIDTLRDAVTLLTGRLRPNVDPLFALRLDAVAERLNDADIASDPYTWSARYADGSMSEAVFASKGLAESYYRGLLEEDDHLVRRTLNGSWEEA